MAALYETVLIARQELGASQVKELTESLEKILTDDNGVILKTENWGLRTLAYRINKARKGHYVLIEHKSPASALHEMERTMRLNEDVLRFMTIKLEKPSEGPSAILGKNDSDDNSNEKEAA